MRIHSNLASAWKKWTWLLFYSLGLKSQFPHFSLLWPHGCFYFIWSTLEMVMFPLKLLLWFLLSMHHPRQSRDGSLKYLATTYLLSCRRWSEPFFLILINSSDLMSSTPTTSEKVQEKPTLLIICTLHTFPSRMGRMPQPFPPFLAVFLACVWAVVRMSIFQPPLRHPSCCTMFSSKRVSPSQPSSCAVSSCLLLHTCWYRHHPFLFYIHFGVICVPQTLHTQSPTEYFHKFKDSKTVDWSAIPEYIHFVSWRFF